MRSRIGHSGTGQRRRCFLRVALLLLGCCAAADVVAQWSVVDVEQNRIGTEAWAKEWLQWTQQFAQWEQQYFTMLNVVQAGPSFFDGTLQYRGVDDGLAQRCPGPSMQAGKLAQQQHAFCQLLLQLDNRRYNVLVDLNRQVERRNREMQAILARRITEAGSSNLGGLKAFDTEMQAFTANLGHDMHGARAALDRYATLGQAVREQQAQLTGQVLGNASSAGAGLAGTLIQGATLKQALDAARHP
ncbi:hypothetical protein [Dyella sp. 2RAB6]|uniref:hypothetical protein n=1 Tax=Dyella sp. 2RAB6 TaxID=3232992 RepID=UPI003F8FDA79